MKKQIILASANKGKIKEISEILSDYNIVSYKDIGFNKEIEETGKSFYENALIKAKTVSEFFNRPALADDSGLCVDCLNGEPGIYSARYSKSGCDKDNVDLLLKNLEGKTNRNAKFICCIVLYYPGGKILTATGETLGKILLKPDGENGFGYDPIFYSLDLKKSLGIASLDEKNTISHRYRALIELKKKIQ